MSNPVGTKNLSTWLDKLQASTRLLICLGVALIVLAVSLFLKTALLTSILLSWDTFCLTLLALSWIMFFGIGAIDVHRQAQRQDESRSATFILSLCAVCVSMIGILLLMHPAEETRHYKELHRAASLLGVGLSWLLLHTLFTLRYAHLYYTDPGAGAGDAGQVGGLEFPAEKAPDYVDFAYFSFVLGMTFQVSDVAISDRDIRRVVLLHSLISFVFNTIVLALSVSILSDLGK